MRAGAVAAVAAFSAGTNARMPLTRAGVVAGAAILLLGPLLGMTSGRGWSFDPDLGFYGALVAALFVVRSGLEEQRNAGLSTFLRYNLASPLEYGLGLLAGLLATWLVLVTASFGAVLAVAGGEAGTAAWHATAWGLRGLVLLGFVPLVERVSTLRIPFLLPVIAYLALLVALSLALGEEAAVAMFAPVDPGHPATLRSLAIQAGASFALAGAGFLLVHVLEGRRSGAR